MKIEYLNKLKAGVTGQVYELPEGRGVRRRLSEMGIRVGMIITIKNIMPLKGPILIMAGHTEIALGHGTASRIKIKIKQV